MESYINSSILLNISDHPAAVPSLSKRHSAGTIFYLDTLYFSQEALLQPRTTSFKTSDPLQVIKMHFTKAFTFAAIVLAGAAFAAPSPPKPTKPVAPTINQQSNSCGSGTTYCCNGGDGSTANLGTCQAQGNLPPSKGVSWASTFWVT